MNLVLLAHTCLLHLLCLQDDPLLVVDLGVDVELGRRPALLKRAVLLVLYFLVAQQIVLVVVERIEGRAGATLSLAKHIDYFI